MRATIEQDRDDILLGVSIHARVMRATPPNLAMIGMEGFNPRPRDAGDIAPQGMFEKGEVSIHARVMRATVAA